MANASPQNSDRTATGLDQAGREAEWMMQARNGDRSAYGRIVLAYQDRIYNSMVRMVGDVEEARELTQEAFTRGLIKLSSFRGDAAPYTWLFRIAVNLAISQLRKQQRRRTFSLDASPPGDGDDGQDQASGLLRQVADANAARPDETLLRREQAQRVLDALGRLDSEYRAVLVMRDVEGFDYQQMADILGLPLGTLKSRLFRARLALREQLLAYVSGSSPAEVPEQPDTSASATPTAATPTAATPSVEDGR